MARNSDHGSKEANQGNRDQDQNDKRSGQETMGKRGQRLDKKEEERYRSNEQPKGRGRHGGNR
ncbi:MAG TPA: hypothetical protein VD993_03910 [Chitinophagaceae bacterium]|nr:hypothetical protein [Chitinophagaceae bacterium]